MHTRKCSSLNKGCFRSSLQGFKQLQYANKCKPTRLHVPTPLPLNQNVIF